MISAKHGSNNRPLIYSKMVARVTRDMRDMSDVTRAVWESG